MDLITYETIRNAQRAEKEEELQKLPEGFFESVRNWFSHKEKMRDTTSLLEIENAKKLLEDIINRREKKIVLAALRTVRGDVPPTNLGDNERRFFDQVVEILKIFKTNMNEKFKESVQIVEEKIEEAKESIEKLKKIQVKPEVEVKEERLEEEKPIKVEVEKIFPKPNGKMVVKILSDLPKFVGPNLESYGPLKTGDVISLPDEIGNLLINRKVAENILE